MRAILSNLEDCQFAPSVVILHSLIYVALFEDSQTNSPIVIPLSHRNIKL